jgi:hypothetical protein
MLMHDKVNPQIWEALNREIEAAPRCFAIRTEGCPGRGHSSAPSVVKAANGSAHALPASPPAVPKAESCQPRFCGGCGTTLWEQCPSAMRNVPTSVCGTRPTFSGSPSSKQLQTKLAEAQEQLAAFR